MRLRIRLLLLAALAALVVVGAACGDTSGTDTTVAAMEEMEDDHEHDHEAAEGREWDSGAAPTVGVSVSGDPESGWTVLADVPGFAFTVGADHVPGEGHGHLLVDGELVSMIFEPSFVLTDLEPGMHHIEVTLSANDHLDFVSGGEHVGGSVMLEVPGEVAPADVSATASYIGGEVTASADRIEAANGDLVELVVASDVADEVHVHGYDVLRDLMPGHETVLRFTADIQGIFEVELEESGLLLLELQVS